MITISTMTDNYSNPSSISPTRSLLNRVLRSPTLTGDQHQTDFERNFGKENILDGCYHVYLDVGSNIGIQVRKLFEPELYPRSLTLPLYDAYFGPSDENRNKLVCAVGFEPNPRHTSHLRHIEEAHSACGWRSYFYTETAGINFDNNVIHNLVIKENTYFLI
jgi:hypothetical protein